MMMMVILIFSSIRMEGKNEEPRSYEQKKTKKGGLDDFSPNSFLLSFFLPTTYCFWWYIPDEYATHNYQTRRPTAQRTESSTKREKRETKGDKAFDHGRRRKGQTMADDDEQMPPRGRQFRNDTMNDGGKNVGKKYKDADDDDRNGWKKKKKHRGGKNTSLSLEAFARAGKSTYDKREVLKKRRAEMAAKINKFRKVLKKAGEFVEPTKGFDPEEYAKKLTKMEDPIGNIAFVEREKMEEYVGKKVLRDDDNDDDDRKKNKKQEEGEEDDEDDTPPEEHRGVSGKKKNKQKERPRTAHEWKMLKAQPERDRIKKEREEREKKFQEVQKIRDAKRKERGKLRHSMMKVNRKGQPLMKNRIDAILAKLEKK